MGGALLPGLPEVTSFPQGHKTSTEQGWEQSPCVQLENVGPVPRCPPSTVDPGLGRAARPVGLRWLLGTGGAQGPRCCTPFPHSSSGVVSTCAFWVPLCLKQGLCCWDPF